MKIARPIAALLGVFACWSAVAVAQEPGESRSALVQEHFTLESPFLQERAELQLTTGSRWWRQGSSRSAAVPMAAEFGVTSRLQVSAEAEIEDELGEVELGLRWAVLPDAQRLLVSVGIDAGLGDEGLEWTPRLGLARALGAVQLVAGAAATLGEDGVAAGAALVAPAGPLRLSAEVAGLSGARGALLTPAVTAVLPLNLEVSLGYSLSVLRSQRGNGMYILLTFEREF